MTVTTDGLDDIGVVAVSSYLPGEPLSAEAVGAAADPMAKSPLFRPPTTRHHMSAGTTAAEMAERAARPLFDRLGLEPAGHLDLIMTNTLLPDTPITGCGAELANRLGCVPPWIVDLHNGGCAAFPYMLRVAQALMRGSGARSALLCTVQNTAGQVFHQDGLSRTPQSWVPGDGCGVAYLARGAGSIILATVVHHDPASAPDMNVALRERRYWEPGHEEFNVGFQESSFAEILERGNSLVPAVVRDVCAQVGTAPGDIDVLVTNQPNRQFLRNWREKLGVGEANHYDTFDRCGNLYGAGSLVSLDHASREGRLVDGDLVVLAGFAHAGDLAAAAALRWRA